MARAARGGAVLGGGGGADLLAGPAIGHGATGCVTSGAALFAFSYEHLLRAHLYARSADDPFERGFALGFLAVD